MSDILKCKVLPSESPRAAANQSRTAVAAAMSSGSTSTTTSAGTPSGSSMTSSVMQELINKALQWIHEQSITFVSWYTSDGSASGAGGSAGSLHPACSILSRLTGAIQKLDGQQDSLAALKELRGILIESDISPFEVNHSRPIRTMLGYMVNEVNQQVGHARGPTGCVSSARCELLVRDRATVDERSPVCGVRREAQRLHYTAGAVSRGRSKISALKAFQHPLDERQPAPSPGVYEPAPVTRP